MSCNLLSLSRKEFKFVPHFFILLLGIPHNLNEVLLGTPTQLQSLLQYFERKGDETEHSMLSNANQEYQVYQISMQFIKKRCKQVCYSKIIQHTIKKHQVC